MLAKCDGDRTYDRNAYRTYSHAFTHPRHSLIGRLGLIDTIVSGNHSSRSARQTIMLTSFLSLIKAIRRAQTQITNYRRHSRPHPLSYVVIKCTRKMLSITAPVRTHKRTVNVIYTVRVATETQHRPARLRVCGRRRASTVYFICQLSRNARRFFVATFVCVCVANLRQHATI